MLTLEIVDRKFLDAALLLIGHGSTLNKDSAAPVFQHAAECRRRALFGEVREAFWKEEPSISSALATIRAPRIFAVPLLISEGYFAQEAIPTKLGLPISDSSPSNRIQRRGPQTLYYCSPVGTHPSMAKVILARARDVVVKHPFPRAPRPEDTALFIAGHGTGRNENSRRAIEEQALAIEAAGIYREVRAIYIEEEPRISSCYELTSAKHLVVVPFFISDGLHSYEDIPVLLGESKRVVEERLAKQQPTWRNPTERRGKLVWYARSVGTEPHLADVIVERVEQAASQTTDVGSA